MSGRSPRTLHRTPFVITAVALVAAVVGACVAGDDGSPRSRSAVTSEQPGDLLMACATGWGIGLFDGAGNPIGRVSGSGADGAIAWSPDGRRIAFQRGSESFVVGADGRNETRLGIGGAPTWSPDGTRVAIHGSPDYLGTLIVVDADGRNRTVVATGTGLVRATWSPDSTSLMYANPQGLMVVSAAGGTPRPLVSGTVEDPRWSPDGTHIAYASGPLLFVVDADGSNRRTLVSSSLKPVLGGWWPDGSRIVYFVRGEVRAVSLSGETNTIAGAPVIEDWTRSVSWSPAGTYLTFMTDNPHGNYIVSADGSNSHVFATANGVQCTDGVFRPIEGPLPSSVSPTTQPPSPPSTAPPTWEEYVGLEFAGVPPVLPGATASGGRMLLSDYGVHYIRQGNTTVLLFGLALPRDWGPWWRVVDVLILETDGESAELYACRVDGGFDGNLVTYYESLTNEEFQTPTLAWRFNTTTQHVEPVDTSRVTCRREWGD